MCVACVWHVCGMWHVACVWHVCGMCVACVWRVCGSVCAGCEKLCVAGGWGGRAKHGGMQGQGKAGPFRPTPQPMLTTHYSLGHMLRTSILIEPLPVKLLPRVKALELRSSLT